MEIREMLVWFAWLLATILVVFFGSLLAVWLKTQIRAARARLSADQNRVLDAVLWRVVYAAEQAKKRFGWSNEQLLQYAISLAASYLAVYGIKLPTDAVEAGIEAHVSMMNESRGERGNAT